MADKTECDGIKYNNPRCFFEKPSKRSKVILFSTCIGYDVILLISTFTSSSVGKGHLVLNK